MLVTGVEDEHDPQLVGQLVKRVELGPGGINPLDRRVDFDKPRPGGATAIELVQRVVRSGLIEAQGMILGQSRASSKM